MADAGSLALSALNVLVVEDEAMVGLGLVSYLEEAGATVTWVANVEEAQRAIDLDPRIDLAIVDLNLGGVMSTPIIDELLARSVRTVLCTGYETSSIEERFRSLPRVEKPFTRSKMRTSLASCGMGNPIANAAPIE